MPRQPGESQGSETDIFGREIPGNFRIWMRRETLAESLWEYGEDALAERLTKESDEGLDQILLVAVWHRINDPEPREGPKLTNGRIVARAAIEFYEGAARDTSRRRRRTRPESERYHAE